MGQHRILQCRWPVRPANGDCETVKAAVRSLGEFLPLGWKQCLDCRVRGRCTTGWRDRGQHCGGVTFRCSVHRATYRAEHLTHFAQNCLLRISR